MPNKRGPKTVIGPDGRERTAEADKRINETFAATFNGVAAERVLDYLRSITINAVAGPDISDQALRHLEGSRHLFGVIQTRIAMGVAQIPRAKESDNGG